MKHSNKKEALLYLADEKNEVYVQVNNSTISRIQEITKAFIVEGHVAMRFADYINMEFDGSIIKNILQFWEDELLVRLNYSSIDFDTMGIISRKMPNNYILTSIQYKEMDCEYGGSTTSLFLVYKKNNL